MTRIDARFIIKMRREFGSFGLCIARTAVKIMYVVDWWRGDEPFCKLLKRTGFLAWLTIRYAYLDRAY